MLTSLKPMGEGDKNTSQPNAGTPDNGPASATIATLPMNPLQEVGGRKLTASGSDTASLGISVKRALDTMQIAVSSKPSKLARCDPVGTMDEKQDSGRKHDTAGVKRTIEKFHYGERHTPLDIEAFKYRLHSYSLKTWPMKPRCISSFHCARYGWKIVQKNLLECVSCHQLMSVPCSGSGRVEYSKSKTEYLENRIKRTAHNVDCIWIKSPTPAGILELPSGKEMQEYIIRAALSFRGMKTYPSLITHYQLIEDCLDFTGLKSKANLCLNQNIEGTPLELLESRALFLTMSGWMIDASAEDQLQCNFCLRNVPLWQFAVESTPKDYNDTSLMLAAVEDSFGAMKQLDPIKNHWLWCPWRVFLQCVKQAAPVDNFVYTQETGVFSMGANSDNTDKRPDVEDYITLAVKIDSDFKSSRTTIYQASSDAASKVDFAVTTETMVNIVNTLNLMISSINSSVIPALQSRSSAECNEIMTLKTRNNVSQNLFLTTASLPVQSTVDESALSTVRTHTVPNLNPNDSSAQLGMPELTSTPDACYEYPKKHDVISNSSPTSDTELRDTLHVTMNASVPKISDDGELGITNDMETEIIDNAKSEIAAGTEFVNADDQKMEIVNDSTSNVIHDDAAPAAHDIAEPERDENDQVEPDRDAYVESEFDEGDRIQHKSKNVDAELKPNDDDAESEPEDDHVETEHTVEDHLDNVHPESEDDNEEPEPKDSDPQTDANDGDVESEPEDDAETEHTVDDHHDDVQPESEDDNEEPEAKDSDPETEPEDYDAEPEPEDDDVESEPEDDAEIEPEYDDAEPEYDYAYPEPHPELESIEFDDDSPDIPAVGERDQGSDPYEVYVEDDEFDNSGSLSEQHSEEEPYHSNSEELPDVGNEDTDDDIICLD